MSLLRTVGLLLSDDSWINITPDQLDEMLNSAYGRSSTDPLTDLSKIADQMKTFVEQESDYRGVELGRYDNVDVCGSCEYCCLRAIRLNGY